jgi:hypothetical protein
MVPLFRISLEPNGLSVAQLICLSINVLMRKIHSNSITKNRNDPKSETKAVCKNIYTGVFLHQKYIFCRGFSSAVLATELHEEKKC